MLEAWFTGIWQNPRRDRIHEFEPVILDSYRQEATFMNAILLARFFPGRSLVIHNLTVTQSEGGSANMRTLTGREELAALIAASFGIPGEITMDVLNGMAGFEDAWS